MARTRLFLERNCILCLATTQDLWCAACEQDILIAINRCPVCAKSSPYSLTCGDCLKTKPAYSNTTVLFQYQYPAEWLIKAFKFQDQAALAVPFAQLIAHKRMAVTDCRLPEIVIPMPLHKKRQQQRGYNQSQLLADQIARQCGLKVDSTLCLRIKNTEPQSTLPRAKRRENIRNAFVLTGKPIFNHIAIVDDVITTGATVNELASLFKKAGCQTIEIWAIARA